MIPLFPARLGEMVRVIFFAILFLSIVVVSPSCSSGSVKEEPEQNPGTTEQASAGPSQEESARQEALRKEQEESARQEALRKEQEEAARQESLRKEQEEAARQEALRKEQDQKQREELRIKREADDAYLAFLTDQNELKEYVKAYHEELERQQRDEYLRKIDPEMTTYYRKDARSSMGSSVSLGVRFPGNWFLLPIKTRLEFYGYAYNPFQFTVDESALIPLPDQPGDWTPFLLKKRGVFAIIRYDGEKKVGVLPLVQKMGRSIYLVSIRVDGEGLLLLEGEEQNRSGAPDYFLWSADRLEAGN